MTIQFKRGVASTALAEGQPGFNTTTKAVYVGDGTDNIYVGGFARLAKTAAYTVVAKDRNLCIDATANTWTLTLTAAATLGAGFCFAAMNSGTGTITVDANGAEVIRDPDNPTGATTLTLTQGKSVILLCDGTGWQTVGERGATSTGTLTGAIAFSGDISPASLAADQDDYNPTGLSTASTLRLEASANVNITGLQGGSDGRILIVHNIGAATKTITLVDSSASSSAANRFALPDGDMVLRDDEACILQYDSTSSRWRIAAGVTNKSIHFENIMDVTACSVLGRATNTNGVIADISGATNDRLLARTSDTLAFQQLTVGMIPNDLITPVQLDNGAACTVFGRAANSAGDRADITLGANGEILARLSDVVDGYNPGDFTAADVTLTDSVLGGTTTATNAYTFERVGGAFDPMTCQGRLTLTTGVSVTTSDVTAAGTLYFALHGGNRVALYDGTRWKLYTFTERSLALTLTSGKNYDVFLYDNAGTITLELSAAWTNDTTRADALTTQDGVYVKSGATTRRWLGTIRASGANTTEDSTTKRFVWNWLNQRKRRLAREETTASWNYTTATWRSLNNSASNRVEVVVGLLGSGEMHLKSWVIASNTNANVGVSSMIGEDSTSAVAADCFGGQTVIAAANNAVAMTSYIDKPVALGYHFYQQLEYSSATGTTTWYGSDATPVRRTGLSGFVMG